MKYIGMAILAALVMACQPGNAQTSNPSSSSSSTQGQPLADPPPEGMATAIFAGGCFWCMEGPFEDVEGVSEVLSGYSGGAEANPTYEDVAYGRTTHAEAVQVIYDPTVVTYDALLDVYWRSIDPTDGGGQFADRGHHYRPVIFVGSDEERATAEASKAALEADGPFDEPIAVEIEDAGDFWVAEDYHQNYYRTNSRHYNRYREGSGRGPFLRQTWGEDIGAH